MRKTLPILAYSLLAVNIGDVYNPPSYLKETTGLGQFVSIILSNALVIAGVLLLILLMGGGLAIIAGAGAGDAQKAEQGKKAATAALAGFLIIFAAYWIIQLVELLTGVKILGQ